MREKERVSNHNEISKYSEEPTIEDMQGTMDRSGEGGLGFNSKGPD